MCIDKWYFFMDAVNVSTFSNVNRDVGQGGRENARLEAPAARLGTIGIAGTSKALIADEAYFCFALFLAVAVLF